MDIARYRHLRRFLPIFWTAAWAAITLSWVAVYAATEPPPLELPRRAFGAFHFVLWAVLVSKIWRAEKSA